MRITLIICLLPLTILSQTKVENEMSRFSLGIRSTASLFEDQNNMGLGYGGHFRIRATKRLNTEWFADYIKTDIDGLGNRETYHIGWSVLFYLKEQTSQTKLAPYVAVGHCFDHAIVSSNRDLDGNVESVKRWSTALQGGLGAHYYFTPNLDASFSTLYMSHLGKDIHAKIDDHEHEFSEPGSLILHEETSASVLEGHLLLTVSLNYRFSKIKPK